MTGTWVLYRHLLRRDRWHLLSWSVGLTILYYSQAVSVRGLYASQAEFDQAARAMGSNAAFVAMAGPARALNTVGGQVAWQATAFGAILGGLMVMFLIGRHTRVEEETGRDELVRASAVGRHATTAAAALVAATASLLAGILVALSLVSFPLAAADSWGLGLGLTLCCLTFGGVALLAAQVTATPRAMYGLTGAVIGVAYVLRAAGDMGTPLLSWVSPIGWYQGMHAFSGLRWWPALLLVAAALVTGALAVVVFGRRDFGDGIVPARPGPARATPSLSTAVGLAWRLQRPAVIGWAVGVLLTGLSYGSMGNSVEELLGSNELTKEMMAAGAGNLVDGFYAVAMVLLGLMSAGFAVSSALRPRSEEDSGRVEGLLATGLSRHAWLLGHMVVTVLGVLVVVGAGGLGLGVAYALSSHDAGYVGSYLAGTLQQVAPVLVLAGVAWLLFGLVPRAVSLAWFGLGLGAVVLLFGDVLRLPAWLRWLSPFDHPALVPAEPFRGAPLLVLLLLAAALAGGGLTAFVRRDVR
jgi:ABC-2 type transport system permease protein